MNVLKVVTDNEDLIIIHDPKITSGNKNVDRLVVEFGPEWELEGAKYYASFFIDDPEKTVDVELDANRSCKIPNQMLAQEGVFHFGVWAEANGQKIKSSENKEYYVRQGAKGTNNAGDDGTAALDKIDEILTENNIEGESAVDKVETLIDTLNDIEALIDESGVIEYDDSF